MVKRKNSGVSLFTALAVGLGSCYAVSATGNEASLVESEKRTKNKKDGNASIRANGSDDKKDSVDVTKLLGFGVGSAGLAAGTATAVDKINKNGNAAELNDRIKQLEDTINRLTEITGQKINELNLGLSGSEQQGDTKTSGHNTSILATVTYICVLVVVISILACILLLIYKFKVFETLRLVKSVTDLIKKTFKIEEKGNGKGGKKFDLGKIEENLGLVSQILDLVKDTLEIKEKDEKGKNGEKKFNLEKLKETLKIIKLIGPMTKIIMETFEIKENKDEIDLGKLQEMLNTVKSLLKDPANYTYDQIKKLCKKKGLDPDDIIKLVKDITQDPLSYINKLYKKHSGVNLNNIISKGDLGNIEKEFRKKFPKDIDDFNLNKKVEHNVNIINEKPEQEIKRRNSLRINGGKPKLKEVKFDFDLSKGSPVEFVFDEILEKLNKQKKDLLNEINEVDKLKEKIIRAVNNESTNLQWMEKDVLPVMKVVVDRIQVQINEIEQDIAKKQKEIDEKQNEIDEIQKGIDKKKKNKADKLKEKKSELEGMKKSLKESLENLNNRKAEFKSAINDKSGPFKEVREKRELLKKELGYIVNELEEKQKKLNKIETIIFGLKDKKSKIVEIISSKYNKKSDFKNNKERFDFIFTEINSYIQEESGGDLDELLGIMNMFTKAISQGELLNLILQQKTGPETLEKTILPILNLAKDVALALKKQEEAQKKKNLNLTNKIDDKKSDKKTKSDKNEIRIKEEVPEKTSLETIVTNVTNSIAALQELLTEFKDKKIEWTGKNGINAIINKFKDNFNTFNISNSPLNQ